MLYFIVVLQHRGYCKHPLRKCFSRSLENRKSQKRKSPGSRQAAPSETCCFLKVPGFVYDFKQLIGFFQRLKSTAKKPAHKSQQYRKEIDREKSIFDE